MVAVAVPLPPPQHSPMLGHLASSHTVCRPRPRRSCLMAVYDLPRGIGCFRKVGRRGLESELPRRGGVNQQDTHCEVLPSTTRSAASGSGWPETKSSKVNPSSSLANCRFGLTGVASVAVARHREELAIAWGQLSGQRSGNSRHGRRRGAQRLSGRCRGQW